MKSKQRWVTMGVLAGFALVVTPVACRFLEGSTGAAPLPSAERRPRDSFEGVPGTGGGEHVRVRAVFGADRDGPSVAGRDVVLPATPRVAVAAEVPPVTWEELIVAIGRTSGMPSPHSLAWPLVDQLAAIVGAETADGDSRRIATGLEHVLADPYREESFVRAGILLALGQGLDTSAARELAASYIDDETGELGRTAWLVLGLLADGEPGLEMDAGKFGARDSRSGLSTWPAVVRAVARPEDTYHALQALLPAHHFLAPIRPSVTDVEVAEGVFTREIIVISQLGPCAGVPGPVQDQLLVWARVSDMSRACMWVLCHAARDDDELAYTLGRLAVDLGIYSSEGGYLMRLLVSTAHQPELVMAVLAEMMLVQVPELESKEILSAVHAMSILGVIAGSDDPSVADEATDLMSDLAVDSTTTEEVRVVSLVQLGISAPERVIEAVGRILPSGEGPRIQFYAATLARLVPEEHYGPMKEILLDSYDAASAYRVREAYVRALMVFGGMDARQFLAGINGAEELEPGMMNKVEAFLAADR